MFIGRLSAIIVILIYAKLSGACQDDSQCHISRIHSMNTADCYHLDIRKFPKCLGRSIQVIDLSMNRIRKVTKDDLAIYPNIEMLYLSDNMLSKVDEGVLKDLTSLKTLDVSMNPLTSLPVIIFHLPSLKNLYLSQMVNMNIVEVIENAKPITSPLQHLDVSASELESFPSLGIVPTLSKLNVSGNNEYPITLNFENIAGLCNLKIFDTSNTTVRFTDECDCWNINQWLYKRDVRFTPFRCNVHEKDCPYIIQFEYLKMFEQCEELYQQSLQQARLLNIGVPVLVTISVIILGIFIYWNRRRRRRNKKPALLKEKYEADVLVKSI